VTHDIGTIGKYASKLLYIDKEVIFYGGFDDFLSVRRYDEILRGSRRSILFVTGMITVNRIDRAVPTTLRMGERNGISRIFELWFHSEGDCRRAFISVLCSTTRGLLVLRRLSMIGDGLAHVTFGEA